MLVRIWHQEPAAVMGLLQAILAAAVTFGLDLNDQQLGMTMAVLSAAQAIAVRCNVRPHRPNADHDDGVDDPALVRT